MSETAAHGGLLLKVITHDLLSPLTAAKWYSELLAQGGVGAAKEKEYLEGIAKAANLGIAITKHVQVAGRLLGGDYRAEIVSGNLSTVVERVLRDMQPQFERHGVSMDMHIDAEERRRELDQELTGLLLWSAAKYMLTASAAGSTVTVRGFPAAGENDSAYAIIMSLAGVVDRKQRIQAFSARTSVGDYDQAFVFAEILHEIANASTAVVSLGEQEMNMLLELTFE